MGVEIVDSVRSNARRDYPALSRLGGSFALSPSITTISDVWSMLLRAQADVRAATNFYLANIGRLSAAQRESYEGMRVVWHDAQVRVLRGTRALFARDDLHRSNALLASLGNVGWLPRLDQARAGQTVDAMSRGTDGNLMFLGTHGLPLVQDAETAFTRANFGFADGDGAAAVYVAGNIATLLRRLTFPAYVNSGPPLPQTPDVHAAAQSPAAPNGGNAGTVTAAAAPRTQSASAAGTSAFSSRQPLVTMPTPQEQAALDEIGRAGKSYTLYYVLGAAALAGLGWWFFFRTPASPRRRFAGIGTPSRLKTLDDNVPSRYGLEVE